MTNWIGLHPLGVTPGSQGSITWLYTSGTVGTVSVAASSLPSPGTYALWYLNNNGYSVLAGGAEITIQS